jgi:hypothetical protein
MWCLLVACWRHLVLARVYSDRDLEEVVESLERVLVFQKDNPALFVDEMERVWDEFRDNRLFCCKERHRK